MKHVRYNTTWEKLWMSFMVYAPKLSSDQEVLMTCDYLQFKDKPMKRMNR